MVSRLELFSWGNDQGVRNVWPEKEGMENERMDGNHVLEPVLGTLAAPVGLSVASSGRVNPP